MYRTSYHLLQHYNTKSAGTVQGPQVLAQTPNMNQQTPLYPMVKHGYNALVYDGTGGSYYKINSGPYGALEKGNCSSNFDRRCTGGQQKSRENYRGNGGGSCNTDNDCNPAGGPGGGTCVKHKCVCNPPWFGPHCMRSFAPFRT